MTAPPGARRQPQPVLDPTTPPPPARYLHRAPPRFHRMPPARPTRPEESPPAPAPPPVRDPGPGRRIHALLGLVALVALVLRLRDPWTNPVIGAEDPYLHMERTWNLLQGKPVHDYPVGFMAFLAPFAALGPDAFYLAARFLPALLGVASVLGVFFLARTGLDPLPSLAAATLVAVMPEHVFRTNLLFPTAVDLAVLPLFFLALVRLHHERPWTIAACVGLSAFLTLIHPWVVALLFPTVLAYGILMLARRREGQLVAVAGGTVGLAFLGFLLWSAPLWHPTVLVRDHALPRLLELLDDPRSLFPLPPYVRLSWMLTLPALLLAVAGAVIAVAQRSRVGVLALLWSGSLVPLALVDWFDIWYIPHRVVAFLGLGVAVLAGFPLQALLRSIEPSNAHIRTPVGLAALAALLLLGLPYGLHTQAWYRNYDASDYEAWSALEEEHASLLIAGSWQARAGYRALTGLPAEYSPVFFEDPRDRDARLQEAPDLIVLVDAVTRENGHDTSFLKDWRLVGRWDDVEAYQR